MARLTTNQRMARSATGQFMGLSARALGRAGKLEARIEAKLQMQLAAVQKRLADNAVYSLKGAMYVVTQQAKALIVRAKGPAAAGRPPHTRGAPRKNIRAAIRYFFDKSKKEAIIGPSFAEISDVGQLMEKGGDRPSTPIREDYAARPFMLPALEMSRDKIPEKFRAGLV